MSEQIDWGRLDRYFSGELTSSEAAAVRRWIAEDPARAAEVEAAQRIWLEAGVIRRGFNVSAAKEKMHVRMAESARSERRSPAPRLTMPVGSRWPWAIAAGLAALLAGAVVWRAARFEPRAPASTVGMHQYITRRGERSEIRLSDGTRVVLGPESRLTVAATFGGTARDVELDGLGYFEVTHDEQRPFAVRAGGQIARDLGTKFVVRAYATEHAIHVAVAEGLVGLGSAVLSAGQIGEQTERGPLTIQGAGNLDRYFAWTTGRLVFDETPLVDALPELSRWYNLSFQLADTDLARVPLTGTLQDRPNAETLELLALSLKARVERHGDTIVIGRRDR